MLFVLIIVRAILSDDDDDDDDDDDVMMMMMMMMMRYSVINRTTELPSIAKPLHLLPYSILYDIFAVLY